MNGLNSLTFSNGDVMGKISLELFGTPDYNAVLDVMAPSDSAVKEFWRRCRSAGLLDVTPMG